MNNSSVHLNIPNAISVSRIGLAAAFIAVDSLIARATILVVAAFTDFLDGWIARRTARTSVFGALLDPVADRLFAVAVVITFLLQGDLHIWHVAALLFRDASSLLGWFVARSVPSLRKVRFRSRLPGKLVTVVQFCVFLAVLFIPSLVDPLVIISLILAVIATTDYTLLLWREREEV